MKSIFKLLVSTLLLSTSFAATFAQNIELNIYPKDSVDATILKTIPYVKTHNNKTSALNQLDSISAKLVKIGYINHTFKTNETKNRIDCEILLNEKIELIRIYYPNNSIDIHYLDSLSLKATTTYFDISFDAIENTLNQLIKHFENLGHPFTSVYLSHISKKNQVLTAQLNLTISKKRTIDNIVIKGYPEFPKKFLKRYLNIKDSQTFNINALNDLNDLINTIPFINQIKKPEVLFTADSTSLYLYLKKSTNSSFDGIIGFSNEDTNGGIKFNGYLDLILNNILNKGETFGVHWENTQNLNSTLKLNFNSPYIFNSNILFNGNFSIFKQDTSYVNTTGAIELGYTLNRNHIIQLTGTTEKSNTSSTTNTNNTLDDFSKNLIGISYLYNILEKPIYYNRYKFFINTGFLIGNKKSQNINEQQRIFQLSASYTAHFNTRNSIYLKTKTQLLNTTNPFENELFRIGGFNSIRGFDEQSILTPKYNVTNIEYHYAVNTASYIYSITDFAILQDYYTKETTQLYGLGLGYFLNTKRTILNLSYAVGTNYNSSFNINNSKVHIKITYPF